MSARDGYGAGLDSYRRTHSVGSAPAGASTSINPYESFRRGNDGTFQPNNQVMSYDDSPAGTMHPRSSTGSVSSHPTYLRATVMVDEATERGVSEVKANKVRVELISLALESSHSGEFVAGAIRQRLKTLDVVVVLNTLTLLDELMRTCPYFYRYVANDRFFRRMWRFVNPSYKDGVKVLFKNKPELRSMEVAERVLILWRAWAETLQKMYAGKYEPAAAFIIERYNNKRMKVQFPPVPDSEIPWVCVTTERNRERFRMSSRDSSSSNISFGELESTVELFVSMIDGASSAREIQESEVMAEVAGRCRDMQDQLDHISANVDDEKVARTVALSEKLGNALRTYSEALDGKFPGRPSAPREYQSDGEVDIDDPRYVAEQYAQNGYDDVDDVGYDDEEEYEAQEYYEEPARREEPTRGSPRKLAATRKKKPEAAKKTKKKDSAAQGDRPKKRDSRKREEAAAAAAPSQTVDYPVAQMSNLSMYGMAPGYVAISADGTGYVPYPMYSAPDPSLYQVGQGAPSQYSTVETGSYLSVNPPSYPTVSSGTSSAYSTISSNPAPHAQGQVLAYPTTSTATMPSGSSTGSLVPYQTQSISGHVPQAQGGQLMPVAPGSPPVAYGMGGNGVTLIPPYGYQGQPMPSQFQPQPIQATSLGQSMYGSFASSVGVPGYPTVSVPPPDPVARSPAAPPVVPSPPAPPAAPGSPAVANASAPAAQSTGVVPPPPVIEPILQAAPTAEAVAAGAESSAMPQTATAPQTEGPPTAAPPTTTRAVPEEGDETNPFA